MANFADFFDDAGEEGFDLGSVVSGGGDGFWGFEDEWEMGFEVEIEIVDWGFGNVE